MAWGSDKDGPIGNSTPTSDGEISFSYADLTVNTHTITMTVTDEVGATCTKAIDYTVGTPPEINIDAPLDGAVVDADSAINFMATVSDAQDQPDEVSLDWALDGSTFSTQGALSNGVAQFSDSTLAYGSYTLLVTATDSDGLTAADQVGFTVNGLPSAPVLSITPDPASTSDGLTVVIGTDSVDPEGSTIAYSYEWLLGGAVQSAHTTSQLPASATAKGEQWSVRVTPNDGISDGAVGSASITIQNTAPTLSGLSITPAGTTYNDDVLTCAATVTDPDESPAPSYEWSIAGNVVGSAAQLDLAAAGAMPDDVLTCTVSVVDSDGASASDSLTRSISNRAPMLSGTVISPATAVTTSTALTCSSSVADDDGEALTPTYSWTIGASTYTGDSLQLDPSMVLPGDVVTCTVDVVDGSGATACDSVTVTVENTLPSVTASISANGSSNSGELTCSATATDVDDGVAPAITVAWSNAAGSLGSANPLQLDPSMGVDGDSITCTATATDLSGGSATATAGHVITNTPPVIDSISISPMGLMPTPTIWAVTYRAQMPMATRSQRALPGTWMECCRRRPPTSSSGVGCRNRDPTCRATPNDGKVSGAFAEDSQVVQNTPPVLDSISIAPANVYTNDSVTATLVVSDIDSSQSPTVSYEWHVVDLNGTDSIVQSGASNSLDGAQHFSRDELVYVVATANDGVADSTPLSSNGITVLNTAPTAPVISISP